MKYQKSHGRRSIVAPAVVNSNNINVVCGGWSKRKTLFGGDGSKDSRIEGYLDPKTDAAKIRAFFIHRKFDPQKNEYIDLTPR